MSKLDPELAETMGNIIDHLTLANYSINNVKNNIAMKLYKREMTVRNELRRLQNAEESFSKRSQELEAKLEETEKRYNFYTILYRQYTTDLLILCTYTRALITNEIIKTHLESNFPEILERFQMIVFETGGQKAA